jgi:hypothetical protein
MKNTTKSNPQTRGTMMKVISIIKRTPGAPYGGRFSDGSGYAQGFKVSVKYDGTVVIRNGTWYSHVTDRMKETLPAIEQAIKAAGLSVEIDLPYATR